MEFIRNDARGFGNTPQEPVPLSYRYAVKQVNLRSQGNILTPVTFIVLVDQNSLPVRVTHLQDYVADGEAPSSPFKAYMKKRCLYFTGMLNHIIFEKQDEYQVSSVLQIKRYMMQEYFDLYAGEITEKADDPRRPQTTWECVRICTFTMYHLCKRFGQEMALKVDDLVTMKTFRDYRGTQVTKLVPTFEAHDRSNVWPDPIFRELPTKAFEVLIPLAFLHAPDIAFALCLQAFGGLRPGEVCCVRQECSPLGPGITHAMDMQGRSVPRIDLTKSLVLRNDNIVTGRIKCPRMQKIYPDFIGAFEKAYQFHQKYLASHSFSADYAPMFINNHGQAMTYDVYRNRFDVLLRKHFIPALLRSEDNELRIYGTMLQEHPIDPHALRHFFTVQLVLRGLNAAQLMEWRGDHSIDSANAYIARKSELIQMARSTGSAFTELLIHSTEEARNV